jgi:CRISPR-associated exonuclease Cas4
LNQTLTENSKNTGWMKKKPDYSDDDPLLLSGIQHYAFCPRQWALIHIEQQWEENVKTVEGQHLHQRVDDP